MIKVFSQVKRIHEKHPGFEGLESELTVQTDLKIIDKYHKEAAFGLWVGLGALVHRWQGNQREWFSRCGRKQNGDSVLGASAYIK